VFRALAVTRLTRGMQSSNIGKVQVSVLQELVNLLCNVRLARSWSHPVLGSLRRRTGLSHCSTRTQRAACRCPWSTVRAV
jgi:hypothetical protein